MEGKKAPLILEALGAAITLPVVLFCLHVGESEEVLHESREWLNSISPWSGTN